MINMTLALLEQSNRPAIRIQSNQLRFKVIIILIIIIILMIIVAMMIITIAW